jgi:hypothetical protein
MDVFNNVSIRRRSVSNNLPYIMITIITSCHVVMHTYVHVHGYILRLLDHTVGLYRFGLRTATLLLLQNCTVSKHKF